MPKGKKIAGRDWKPGESGNPNGRPPLPPEIREARKLTTAEFIRVANKLLDMTKAEVVALQKAPDSSIMESILASILVKGFNEGDASRLTFFLDRLLGKVKDRVELSGDNEKPVVIEERLSLEEMKSQARHIIDRIQKKMLKDE